MDRINEAASRASMDDFVRRPFRPIRALPIVWSDHAIERVAERFGFTDREIPNSKINEKADPLPLFTNFKVRDGGVVYVCCKFRKFIMVKTVYPKDPKDKTSYRRKKKKMANPNPKTYIGIKPCGCKTSAIMDDGFTPEEIHSFIESCEQRGMTVELHDQDWVKKNFGYCEMHGTQHKTLEQKILKQPMLLNDIEKCLVDEDLVD